MASMFLSSRKHSRIAKQSLWLLMALILIGTTACTVASSVASDSETSVTRAARRYRMQVFQSYHGNRAEYDRRIEVGHRILEEWKARGNPQQEEKQLVDWFRQATDASRLEFDRSLPDYDPFTEITQSSKQQEPPRNTTPEQIVNQKEGVNQESVLPLNVDSNPSRRRRASEPLVSPQPPTLVPPTDVESIIGREVPELSRPQSIPPAAPLQEPLPKTNQRAIAKVEPRETAPKATAPQAPLQRLSREASMFPEPDATLAGKTNDWQLDVPGPANLKEQPDIGPIPQLEPGVLVEAEVEIPRVASNLRTPFPAASINVEAVGSNTELTPTSKANDIDLGVLAARIRASNLRLAEIDSELSENGLWDAKRLRPLVDRFDRMLSGRRLSEIYFEALSRSERQRVAVLEPVQPTINLLAQRLFEARVAVAEDPVFQPTDSEEADELQNLIEVVDSWD